METFWQKKETNLLLNQSTFIDILVTFWKIYYIVMFHLMMICRWTSDVTRLSKDQPYKAGVFPDKGWKPKEGSTWFSVFCLFWHHQVWRPIAVQDSESEGSTWLCLGCFDLQPRHKIIYNWKPGGPLFSFSTLIWKNTSLMWSISLLDGMMSEGFHLYIIISSTIVCVLNKISNYKWDTTISFIGN